MTNTFKISITCELLKKNKLLFKSKIFSVSSVELFLLTKYV